jgi:hypothetical protein
MHTMSGGGIGVDELVSGNSGRALSDGGDQLASAGWRLGHAAKEHK